MYRVYEYGQSTLREKIDETAAVEQIYRRHKLWNTLVELDRALRARTRELLRDELQDEIDALQAHIGEIRQEMRFRRRERKRTVDMGTLREQLVVAREKFRELVVQAKASRSVQIVAGKEALAKLRGEHYAAVKQATRESGLYWCNYDNALLCYDVARKRAAKAGVDLRFHRWDGSGKVAVRFQKGLPVEKAFAGTDTRFQLDPVMSEAYTSPMRAERRRLTRTRCRVRVGSKSDRSPVWLELPLALHRPLPEGAKIRTVFAVRDLVAGRVRWRVCICVDDGVPEANVPVRTGPAVAVDLGWRMVAEGLRVAYWTDETGGHGQLVLPCQVLFEYRKLADLQHIQDQHLNEAKAALHTWLASQDAAPGWMGDVSHLGEWRSRTRMEKLAKAMPADGDPELRRILEMWLERHRHLTRWEENLRDQVMRCRREIYRRWVRQLASTHGMIIVEKFDLRRVSAHGDEEAKCTRPLAGDQRVIAAVSVLRHTLKAAGQVVEVNAAYSTQHCSWCGNEENWDAARLVLHGCSRCGELFDQDHNAARNLLRSHIGANGAERSFSGIGPDEPEEVHIE
jgi:hypothetical protein